MSACTRCGAPVGPLGEALTKKLVNRGCERFYCLPCLAAQFGVSEELLRSGPVGFLFVSHNPRPENLARYDCILLMEDGRIQAAGSYQEIKNILMKEEC